MEIKTIGIIGYGHFGMFLFALGQRFFPNVKIRVYSRRFPADGKTFFTLVEAAECDVVILCGSISEYEEQIQAVAPLLAPHSILVDVATVKLHTTELLKKHCPNCHYISTHPMFGPESYEKHHGNVEGFRIVVTDYALINDGYIAIKSILTALGFEVIEMTADEHDKRLAETLFLTHYVSQSILSAGFTRTSIDTLSFQFMMDAVESVKNDRKLFEDVYHYNKYCQPVAERLHAAQESVWQSIQKS
jgi:prephenate dehydrogenase